MTKILGTIPVIPTTDLPAALAFWRDDMGFEIWGWDDPPIYGGVHKDGVEFHLTPAHDPRLCMHASFRIQVEDIAPWHERVQALGRVHENGQLADQPWGYREFVLLDPSGVCIIFCEAIPD